MNIQQQIAGRFLASHPEDAARILEKLPAESTAAQLEKTPPPLLARVLNRMSFDYATQYLVRLSPVRAAVVLTNLPTEISAILLRRIDPAQVERILAKTPRDFGNRLRQIIKYPRKTAGAITDFEVFTLLEEFSVREAIEEARAHARHLSRYLYVLNRDKELLGVMNLRELFMAEPETRISAIMQKNIYKLFAFTDLQSVLRHPGWLDHYALPVVEEGDLFLGALRYNTLLKLEQEKQDVRQSSQLRSAGAALGELYQVGLLGLVQGSIIRPESQE